MCFLHAHASLRSSVQLLCLGLLPRTRLSYQYKYGLNSTYMCGHIDSNTPLFYGTQKNGRRRRQSPEEIGGGAAQNSHTRRATAICDFGGQSSPAAMNRRRSCRRHARRVDCNPHGTPEARDAAAKPSLPPLRPPRAQLPQQMAARASKSCRAATARARLPLPCSRCHERTRRSKEATR